MEPLHPTESQPRFSSSKTSTAGSAAPVQPSTMPLRLSSDRPEDVAKALNSSPIKPAYLVVYASVVDGRMWCGDCRDAEPFVNAKFGDSGETATVIYAGSKPEWVALTLLHPFLCFIWSSFRLIRRIDGEARIISGRNSRSWRLLCRRLSRLLRTG